MVPHGPEVPPGPPEVPGPRPGCRGTGGGTGGGCGAAGHPWSERLPTTPDGGDAPVTAATAAAITVPPSRVSRPPSSTGTIAIAYASDAASAVATTYRATGMRGPAADRGPAAVEDPAADRAAAP